MIAELYRIDHVYVVSQELQGESSSAISWMGDEGKTTLFAEVTRKSHRHIQRRHETVPREGDLRGGTASFF